MDENLVPENQEEQEQTIELTPIEQRAVEMGWRPLEEFNGPEESFIDAKEFVNRKPLFDKIEGQSREIKEMRRAMDALKTHYTKVQETEYNKALSNLKAARKQAITDSDGDRFEVIDTEIKRVESQVEEVQKVNEPIQQESQVNPEFTSWMNRNPWYGSVGYMRAFADELGPRLAAQGLSPREVLSQVEIAIKKEFPSKFRNSNKDDAPDIGTSSNKGTSRKSDGFEMSDQEVKIMNTLIRSDPKLFTKEKYIAELKAAKGIK